MFHLLVAKGGWSNESNNFPRTRIQFSSSNENIARFFKSDTSLNVESIKDIPALLVAETESNSVQQAKVAKITKIQNYGGDVKIHYTVNSDIPTITNQELQQHYSEFGDSNYGYQRTFWKVVEANLYEVILKCIKLRDPQPKVFSIDAVQPNNGQLSVMMPFATNFSKVYAAIQKAAENMLMDCKRADNIWEEDIIIQDIVNLIVKAQVVVCDCTGKNPNVFYEIGIAHTLGKKVILLAQDERDVPFDLRHLRYIIYHNNEQGLEELTKKISNRLKTILYS